jgi:hypothetical protein
LDLSVPWIASVVGDAAARDAWELHWRAFWADYDPRRQRPRGESVPLSFTRADLRRRLAPIRYLRLLVCCPAGLTDAARFVKGNPAPLGPVPPGPAPLSPLRIVSLQAQGDGAGVWVVVMAPDARGMRRFREAYLEVCMGGGSIEVIAEEGKIQCAHAIVRIEQVSRHSAVLLRLQEKRSSLHLALALCRNGH